MISVFFLKQKDLSNSDANKISKRMSYASKISFKTNSYESMKADFKALANKKKLPLTRISSRTSVIIKAHKQGSNIAATVSSDVGNAKIKATTTTTTLKLLRKYYNQVTARRSLKAQELEKINQLIDDKTRTLIKQYSK